jgi:hypothetical protein
MPPRPKKAQKKQPPLATGPKLPSRIRNLAKTDITAAILFARRGRQFSETETILSLYYETLERDDAIKSGKVSVAQKLLEGEAGWTKEMDDEYRRHIPLYIQADEELIKRMVLRAINERDPKKIFELGKAVDFLKTFKNEEGDHIRANILFEKHHLDQAGQKCSIRQLAKLVGWPMKDSTNGFWSLRRIAKELDFPLQDSTQKPIG